jgi:hypothetical protein
VFEAVGVHEGPLEGVHEGLLVGLREGLNRDGRKVGATIDRSPRTCRVIGDLL